MYKAALRKIGIFLAGAAILFPSLCGAGMHELSDGDMAVVYAQGFSNFSLTTDSSGISTANMTFANTTISTWTEIRSMKMGYYGTPLGWDQDWTTVSLGTSGTDLVVKGVYIQSEFSDITINGTRQLNYFRIGATSLTGTITADFNSFSGTILGTTAIPYNRSNLGVAATITSDGSSGFNLTLDKNSGFSFNFGSGSHL
jgi:hypothetical protein